MNTRSPHTDAGALLKPLADDVVREMYSVLSTQWDRDCLHAKVITALLQADFMVRQAASHGGAGGEPDDVVTNPARFREVIRAARDAALEEAAKIADTGCLVPPDGGSPTEDEREMCESIASAIRAHKLFPDSAQAVPGCGAWLPVSGIPETDPKLLGKGINILLFSPKFGIRTGEAFNAHGRLWANVGNLHGNAIDDWGATHWMHLPAEPTASSVPSADREAGK